MSSFEPAIEQVLRHEGHFVDHPSDPGGATKFGISLRYLASLAGYPSQSMLGDIDRDGDIDREDIKNLPREKAIAIYRRYWWDKYNYQAIKPQIIATKIFDLAVNMGSSNAHRCLQRAIRAVIGLKLEEDGVLGPRTLEQVNQTDPHILLAALKSEAAGYYRSIRYPNAHLFLKGWLNRAYA